MKELTSDKIRHELIEKLKTEDFDKNLIILSKEISGPSLKYRKAILKRCDQFSITCLCNDFDEDARESDLIDFCKRQKNSGFIFLQPIKDRDLSILRENIKLLDLDCFCVSSLGKILDGDYSYLPATCKAIGKILADLRPDLTGVDIVIANSKNVIGRPLALYLNSKKATVTLLNSKSINEREKIKRADIFISAIGKANYFDASYFKPGQIIIDCGTNFSHGNTYGDVDIESIRDMDISYMGPKRGVGAITTLSLLEGLL